MAHIISARAKDAKLPIRFAASKLIEGDELLAQQLNMSEDEKQAVAAVIRQMEKERGLDASAAIADMRFQLNGSSVHTGETSMGAASGGWTTNRAAAGIRAGMGVTEYNEYVKMGNEIKRAVDGMRNEIRREVRAQSAPKAAVTCPWCGATTTPDASGCCEYCGGSVNG